MAAAFRLLLCLACLWLAAPGAGAATPLALPSAPASGRAAAPAVPDDPAEVPAFVGRLDDRQARALLLETLAAREAAAPGRPAGLRAAFERARRAVTGAAARLAALAAAIPSVPPALEATLRAHGVDGLPALVGVLARVALAVAAGALAEAILRWGRATWRSGGTQAAPGARTVTALAGQLAFLVASGAVAAGWGGAEDGPSALAFALLAGLVCVRAGSLLAWTAITRLAPPGPGMGRGMVRRALYATIVAWHAVVVACAWLVGGLAEAGAAPDVQLVVGLAGWAASGLLLPPAIGWLSVAVARPDAAESGPENGWFARWLARRWTVVAWAGGGALWAITGLAALEAGTPALVSGLGSALVLAWTPAATALACAGLRRLGAGRRARMPWVVALVRCVRVAAAALALWAIAAAWGLDLFVYASDRLGAELARTVIDVSLVLLGAYLAWEVAKAVLRTEREDTATHVPAGEDGFIQPASRIETFLPLVEKFLLAVIFLVAGMAVLRRLGVDTAPLLAGAGIAGIAIGFGAQALVKDIVSGVFFLLDDAFRLGEYVEIDQTRGTVEGISIRSLRVRHHRGAVHTVPFGTIQRLTNYSRDWIILKLEFLLAFETDLRKVKKLVKEIGKELMDDPEYGPHFLEPVKSQGVRRMEQIGMVVGIKFMAKPGEQFILRREVYQRVRDAFERNGIAFARPQVVVQVPSGRLSEEEADAVAAAAADAAGEPPPERAVPGRDRRAG